MSTRDLCQLSGLARAGLYRKPKPESEHARRLRQAIVNAALDHPAYGTRRTTHQLRRQKLTVNRKRVQRVMREENLLRRNRRAGLGKRPIPSTSCGVIRTWRASSGQRARTSCGAPISVMCD